MKYGGIIGIGNTATIYKLDGGRVLKLFYQGYPKCAAEKEFHNAKAIHDMGFAKPNVYKMINFKEQTGIIFDRVQGESLLDWVMKTEDVLRCATYMAELHKSILSNRITSVTNYKKFLEYNIKKGLSADPERQKKALEMLNRLGNGNTLCHGDFHPGNILLSNGQAVVIDFMNICQGHFLYDIARTVFLVEYTPVPREMENTESAYRLKKTLADSYLLQMDVTREMISDYLSVIAAARTGECPDEHKR